MAARVILAIDQGTTQTTVLAIDDELRVLGKAAQEFAQVFPRPGLVEHRARDIWGSVELAAKKCLEQAKIAPSDIGAIGIANQRETTCLFDKSGSEIHNFIVWQCRRSGDICNMLRDAGHEELFEEKTGLVLDPYFSGTKLKWLFDHVEGALSQAQRGNLLFGTIDTWLAYKLSAGNAFVTDATNASRTLMMDLKTCQWDNELLKILGVPSECLAKICSSSEVYGYTKGVSFLPDGLPIASIVGDQQSALFGQACFEDGEGKATYGTGSFILMNTGSSIVHSKHGLLSSVGIKIGSEVQYCLEGSAFVAGAAVQWLRDGLGVIDDVAQIEELANQVSDSGEVVFVPALTGLGAPYWRSDARGLFSGITRDTTKAHLARAVLEGIALMNGDIIRAMEKDAHPMKSLKVDGGAANNDLLMQLQCNVLGIPCVRPKIVETTALGAAALAGLSVGIFSNKDAFKNAWQESREFLPQMGAEQKKHLLAKWQKAVARA